MVTIIKCFNVNLSWVVLSLLGLILFVGVGRRYLERGAVVKAPSSFKLSSSISEAQRDTLT